MLEKEVTIADIGTDMGVWTKDQTKKGWLTAILELGAWVGCLYSGFLAEILSRKYAILIVSVKGSRHRLPKTCLHLTPSSASPFKSLPRGVQVWLTPFC